MRKGSKLCSLNGIEALLSRSQYLAAKLDMIAKQASVSPRSQAAIPQLLHKQGAKGILYMSDPTPLLHPGGGRKAAAVVASTRLENTHICQPHLPSKGLSQQVLLLRDPGIPTEVAARRLLGSLQERLQHWVAQDFGHGLRLHGLGLSSSRVCCRLVASGTGALI